MPRRLRDFPPYSTFGRKVPLSVRLYALVEAGDTEAIDIFGWPTFLPAPIARQYAQLWTKPRMQRIIDLAKSKNIAIEINEVAHVPDESFIVLAKRANLKFTFGSDSRTPQGAAHLYYCYQVANKCSLTEADMFVPKKK